MSGLMALSRSITRRLSIQSSVDPSEIKSCLRYRVEPGSPRVSSTPTPHEAHGPLRGRRNSIAHPTGTEPLRPCCETCLESLRRANRPHRVSSPLATSDEADEDEVMWSPGARRKHLADEKEASMLILQTTAAGSMTNRRANSLSGVGSRLFKVDELKVDEAEGAAVGALGLNMGTRILNDAVFEEEEPTFMIPPSPTRMASPIEISPPMPLRPFLSPSSSSESTTSTSSTRATAISASPPASPSAKARRQLSRPLLDVVRRTRSLSTPPSSQSSGTGTSAEPQASPTTGSPLQFLSWARIGNVGLT